MVKRGTGKFLVLVERRTPRRFGLRASGGGDRSTAAAPLQPISPYSRRPQSGLTLYGGNEARGGRLGVETGHVYDKMLGRLSLRPEARVQRGHVAVESSAKSLRASRNR